MKLRNGFVSNSSSSSFLIIGVHADEDVYNRLEEKYGYEGTVCPELLDFYAGDEDGYCIGVEAVGYLEKEKLGDAYVTILSKLQRYMAEEDFESLMEDKELKLIYDSYYC